MAWNTVHPFKGARRWSLLVLLLVSISSVFFFGHRASTSGPHSRQVLSRSLEASDVSKGNNVTSELQRRQSDDPYSCGPGKPCSNGACCGASGFCGYGATYCGPGCVSNCGAHAECGKDAVVPGTECPLKTCCSQYGFCGTTDEFCNSKSKFLSRTTYLPTRLETDQ
jgi:chitinase